MAADDIAENALHQLESAQHFADLGARLEAEGRSEEAAAAYLDAYAFVSVTHAVLDMFEDDEYDEAFDQAEELRTKLHEELLERLGVPFLWYPPQNLSKIRG